MIEALSMPLRLKTEPRMHELLRRACTNIYTVTVLAGA